MTVTDCINDDGHTAVEYKFFDVGNSLRRRVRCWDCGTLLAEEMWTAGGFTALPRDAWTDTGRESDRSAR